MGWQVATHLRTELALDALQMALCARHREGVDLTGLTHHSDKGVQFVAVKYSERLAAKARSPPSARPATPTTTRWPRRGEAFNSLFKAECIRNHRRLHGERGMVPPVEFEATFTDQLVDAGP